MSEPNSYAQDMFNIQGLFENSLATQEAKAKLIKHSKKGNLLRVVWQLDLKDACSAFFLIRGQQKDLSSQLKHSIKSLVSH